MAPCHWANEEQLIFLRSQCHEFLEAQKKKSLMKFWNTVEQGWFEKWPEAGTDVAAASITTTDAERNLQELGERIEKKKKQLKSWFSNNTDKARRKHIKPEPFQIQMKPHRRLQAVELYSQKYYKTRVRPGVKLEIHERKLTRKEVLAVIKRRTNAAFEAESEDIKEEIYREVEAAKAERNKGREEGESTVYTPEEYARTLESLPNTLDDFFAELSLRTGWVFTVLAGGPDPKNGGKNRTLGYHSGRNQLGLTFSAAHPSFSETFLKPFAMFVKQVFSSDVCATRGIKNADPSMSESISPSENAEPSTSSASPPESALDGELATTGADLAALEDTIGSFSGFHDDLTLMASTPSELMTPASTVAQPEDDENANIDPVLLMTSDEPLTPDAPTVAPFRVAESVFGFPAAVTTSDATTLTNPYGRTTSIPPITPTSHHGIPFTGQPLDTSPLLPIISTSHGPEITPTDRQVDTIPATPKPKKRRSAKKPSPVAHTLESGSQRARKPVVSKEVIPLTDAAAWEALPDWIEKSRDCLTDKGLGLEWEQCTVEWMKFEQSFPLHEVSSCRLPEGKRHPQVLSHWLQTRKYNQPPQVQDAAAFGMEWIDWWNSLQPTWRRVAEKGVLPLLIDSDDNRDIKTLRKGGPNGLVTVMLGLKWWGTAGGTSELWKKAVFDVRQCLKKLVTEPPKRKSTSDDSRASKKRRT